jgi:hypothetical protein
MVTQQKKHGGSAFPHQQDVTFYHPDDPSRLPHTLRGQWQGGMTLRDYFAGQAIAAMADEVLRELERSDKSDLKARRAAFPAYMLADAMLAEREK